MPFARAGLHRVACQISQAVSFHSERMNFTVPYDCSRGEQNAPPVEDEPCTGTVRALNCMRLKEDWWLKA